MDLIDRARAYVGKMDAAVSGSGGHTATFKVAVALVHGFALTEAEAWMLLREYNLRCQPAWKDRELMHKLKEAGKVSHKEPRGHLAGGRMERGRYASGAAGADGNGAGAGGKMRYGAVPGAAGQDEDGRNWREYDAAALAREQRGDLRVDRRWLQERSPLDVRYIVPGKFLEAVLREDERAVVFMEEWSQGEYLFWKHKDRTKNGWWQLSPVHGRKAVRVSDACDTPREIVSARCGVWWLNQPVTGQWLRKDEKWTRRSEGNVTRWGHMVIESDEEGIEGAWLNLLVQMPLGVVALYTSGGRSVHALCRVDAGSKAVWDRMRDVMKPLLTRLGADRGVFSAVRLTRLPNVWREGKMVEVENGGMENGEMGGKGGSGGSGGEGGTEKGRKGKRKRYVRFPEPQLQELLWLDPLADGEAIAVRHGRRVREIGRAAAATAEGEE